MKQFLIFLGVALIVGALIVGGPEGVKNLTKQRDIQKKTEKFFSLPDLSPDTSSVNTLVTGYKTEDITIIEAVNDSAKNYTKISTLPSDVKSIIPLKNGKQLLYIAGTDDGDLGARLEIKNIMPEQGQKDGSVSVIYEASDRYKIDRILISENHEWVTWYEVRPPAGADNYTHTSDSFRSFKANISNIKNSAGGEALFWTKLTDQNAQGGTVIYLPSLITNDGRVYFDGIVVSEYGLYSGFVDESLTTIIQKDQYNSKPFLFNQRYLAYSAFNPGNNPKLPGGSSPAARESVLNTNEVRVLDLSDPARPPITVGNGDNGEQYKHPVYIKGSVDSELIIAVEVFEISESGPDKGKLEQREIQLLKYRPQGTEKVKVIDVPNGKKYRILSVGTLPNGENTLIIGDEAGILGNLGSGWFVGVSGYQSILGEIIVFNVSRIEKIETIRPEVSGHFEFIGQMEKAPGSSLGIDRNEKLLSLLPSLGDTRGQQLQLATFTPVEPKRARTNPRSDCEKEWEQKGYPNQEACVSCPIYVYSKSVQDIRIKPVTPVIESSAVPLLTKGEWNFKADNIGNLIFPDSSSFNKIDFLFPRGKITIPEYGVVVKKDGFEQALRDYSVKLGFAGREIEDIVNKFLPQLNNAEFIFLSHLPQKQVDQLLGFTAYPEPETKFSHIIYIKKYAHQPKLSITQPSFKSIKRSDYTIVSWGAIIE